MSTEEQRAAWREKNRRWREANPGKHASYSRRYRAADPEKYRVRARERYARNRAIIVEAKDVPCVDCGGRYPTCVMDLHHRDPATKDKTVLERTLGAVNRAWSETRLRAEIAKCDVICANCHRIRHSQEVAA